MMARCEYWKDVWDKKGKNQTDDLQWLDGFEESPLDPKDISDWIIKQIHIQPEDKVLEVGCGSGMIAQYIAKKCDYIGIDYTKSLVDKHIKLLGNSVLIAEANDIPFRDKYFDRVFSYSVFHYFPTKQYANDVVREMLRVSKGDIFIGDIPKRSSVNEHLVYIFDDFPMGSIYDMKFCNQDRFNVLVKVI